MLFGMKNCILLAIWFLIYQEYVCDACGTPEKQNNGAEERIVGGMPVGYYKYPWFAILESVGTRRQVTCGGTLVSNKHVVSAAHCFKGIKGNPANVYQVSLGVYDNCIDNDPNRVIVQVESVKIHDLYEEQDPWYDIAILTLQDEVDFEPICLPEKGTQLPTEGVVTGYGVLKQGGYTEPCEQQEVAVNIFPKPICIRMLKAHEQSWTPHNTIPVKAFCAGYLEGGKDSCQGDSGGPLAAPIGDVYTLFGVVSFGYGCAQPNALGVYTDVTQHIDWIHFVINGKKPNKDQPPTKPHKNGGHKKKPHAKRPQRKPQSASSIWNIASYYENLRKQNHSQSRSRNHDSKRLMH